MISTMHTQTRPPALPHVLPYTPPLSLLSPLQCECAFATLIVIFKYIFYITNSNAFICYSP